MTKPTPGRFFCNAPPRVWGPPEYLSQGFSVSCSAEQTDELTWRGSVLLASTAGLHVPEVWHACEGRHDAREDAIAEASAWAAERYPPV